MTRFTFLVIVTMMTLAGVSLAREVKSQGLNEVKVTVNFKGSKLDKILEDLERQSGFSFTYPQEIGKLGPFTISVKNETLLYALQKLATGNRLSFEPIGNLISVSQLPPAQKPGRISGKVVDDKGEGLPGASIKILETGQTLQTSVDGSYTLSIKPGTYTIEVGYISFQTQRITGVAVTEGKNTPLDVAMKTDTKGLQEVVITSSYKKASIAGLYAQQQNRAVLSDGISAEQISATPDKHIGETLKRITGVSTNDNRKVVIRGIAERYNVALLNGSTLPSTDIQERDFEFNLIPTNMVENIVVAKSITPDMPYGFAGGLVQITTKSVPTENFLSISLGSSFNSRTIGKDFMGYQRGKYDYLGFDDGDRDHFPKDIFNLTGKYNPTAPEAQNKIKSAQVGEQNKRIGGTERFGARTYQALPSQNYQLSLGRVYSLSKTKARNLGFVGSLSYRNTQSNDFIANMRRGDWSRQPTNAEDTDDINTGNFYGFNTTLGALINGGFKTEKHQINTYNLYTRIFDDRFSRITGWSHENPKIEGQLPFIEEDDRPKFSDLLQNKLGGSHQLGPLKLDWNVARTHLKALEQDAIAARLNGRELANKPVLFEYFPNQGSDPGKGSLHRDQYLYKERNLSAEISAAYDLKLGKTIHTLKVGANYLGKHAWYDWNILPIVTADGFNNPYRKIPIQEWGNYMSMENPAKDLFYNPGSFSLNSFEGKNITRGGFAMIDSKPLPNLRIVGGVRAEYFRTDTIKNGASRQEELTTKLYMDDSVRTYLLPSVNMTYTPLKNVNVRVSYAESVIRPGLMENSRFARYNPNFGAVLRSRGMVSTHIKNYDAKLEWFAGPGEIISAGYFYKYFDKPAEYYADNIANSARYEVLITNSDWAKVSGWEFELRKNLGFVHNGWSFLNDIYLSGNLTLQKSEVRAREKIENVDVNGADSITYVYANHHRALYGQIPRQYNLGARYAGKRLGLNLVFNHMGYKTFMTGSSPEYVEYERPRGQLDAQISYKFLKGKMETKLNMSNLTDAPYRFYINEHTTYEVKPESEGILDLEWNERYQYKEGFSEKFEEGYIDENKFRVGDRQTFTRYLGRSFSFSVSYNF